MALYCERHRVMVMDRGAKNRIGQLSQVVSVKWGRVRDDFSEASVVIIDPDKKCTDLLNVLSPNRHELVIFRGKDRVWEGPITRIGRQGGTIELAARDVIHYLYRTVCHNEWDSSARWIPDSKDPHRVFQDNTEPVVDRAYNMIYAELARKEALDPPVNVREYVTKVRAADIDDERKANRRTLAYAVSVYDDMESLAQYGGLDYTTVGRRIILNDVRVELSIGPTITNADLIGSSISVTSYGMDSITRAFTSGDNGMYGVSGGIDPYYGEWESIESMMDEDSTEAPTQNSLNNAANYNMQGKLPVPTLVHVPDNSRLNPNSVISLQDLVPGVIFPVRAELPSITITQYEKLNQVSVSEDSGGEAITITLGPPPTTPLENA